MRQLFSQFNNIFLPVATGITAVFFDLIMIGSALAAISIMPKAEYFTWVVFLSGLCLAGFLGGLSQGVINRNPILVIPGALSGWLILWLFMKPQGVRIFLLYVLLVFLCSILGFKIGVRGAQSMNENHDSRFAYVFGVMLFFKVPIFIIAWIIIGFIISV